MTKEEILKAADEAVEMFKMPIDESDFHVPENITGVSHSSDEYAKVLESETNSVALQCAILHYEDIVERDRKRYESLFELQKKGREAIELEFVHNELLESKDVLIELKSRL